MNANQIACRTIIELKVLKSFKFIEQVEEKSKFSNWYWNRYAKNEKSLLLK